MSKTEQMKKFIFIFLIALNSCENEVKVDLSRCKETYGYVEGVTGNKDIHYNVGNQFYRTRFNRSHYGEIEKEMYLLKYDTLNPNKVEICYTKPIFLADEKTDLCSGEILKIYNYKWPFGKAYAVRYTYSLAGVLFEREQDIPIDFAKYPKLKEGKKILVEYWIDNPQRAILRYEESKCQIFKKIKFVFNHYTNHWKSRSVN
jgi:hypothetical protein